jgi:hypothetical protein
MTNETETLDRAIECAKQERQRLQQETEAFETFREEIGHTRTGGSANRSTEMDDLFESYRKQVFEPLNYEDIYGESCRESLKTELTPALADGLVNDQPLTQRQKRNLLVTVNEIVNRRTTFSDRLKREQESLQTVREAHLNIEETLRELPGYSLQRLSLEEVVDIWEICEKLINQCDRLAEARQRCFRNRQLPAGPTKGPHTLNEYLYADLETQFPALYAISGTRRRIDRYRDEPESLDGFFGDGISKAPVVNGSSD